jgi:hypothetical protein
LEGVCYSTFLNTFVAESNTFLAALKLLPEGSVELVGSDIPGDDLPRSS